MKTAGEYINPVGAFDHYNVASGHCHNSTGI